MNLKHCILLALLAIARISPALAGDLFGQVRFVDGTPVPVATVAISDGEHQLVTAVSDADGNFVAQNLPEGLYGVTASTGDSGAAFAAKVPVLASGKAKALSLTLDSSGGYLHGKVLVSAGSSPQALQIIAVRVSADTGDNFVAKTVNGQYQVSLIPGSYHLIAKADGWSGQSRVLHAPADSATYDIRVFPEKGSDPKLADEIIGMEARDQAGRLQMIDNPNDPDLRAALRKTDADNEHRVMQIIEERGWPGPALVGQRATDAMWVLVQHTSAPVLKKCLPMMKAAAEQDELSLDKLALSTDRVLINDGQKQRYGTQEGPIEDEAHVDQRRAEMDMGTLAEYRAQLKQFYTPHSAHAVSADHD